MRRSLLVALIALGFSAHLGATNVTVTVFNGTFQPPVLTIPIGTTVVWDFFNFPGTGPGQVKSTTNLFDSGVHSGAFNAGSFSFTFNSLGTFFYTDPLYPSGPSYSGEIDVVTPEPATLVLLGTGLLGAGIIVRRTRRKSGPS